MRYLAGLGVVPVLLYWALGFFQLWAFAEGVNVWLHWGFWGALAVFIGLSMIPFGQIGIVILAFVGADRGWDWAWWQALLLVAPFAILSIFIQLGGGASAILQRYRAGRSPAY